MNAVFKHSQSKGAARLVLLALADEAGDEGYVTAYKRSQSHIASKANVDMSSVARVAKSLVELGELEILKGGKGRASTDYRIILPGIGTPQDKGSESSGSVPSPLTVSGQTPQDKGSIIPLLPVDPPVSPKDMAGTFEEFWSVYPRREKPATARKAWAGAIKKVSPDQIIRAAERYRDDPNREKAYTQHPASWLNAESWADDPLPSRIGHHVPTPDAPRMSKSRQNSDRVFERMMASEREPRR